MSGGFTQPVAILNVSNDELNFSNGVIPVSISNLNANSNAVLYTDNAGAIKGNSTILQFDESLKKLTVNETLGYVSAYPIGVEAGFDEQTFCTGFFAQNKNSQDGASVHILVTNDLGTDSTNYGGLDMASSGSIVQNDQFATMPNSLGLSSQTSSIVLTSNSGGQEPVDQNENIFLCYDNGTRAHSVNRYGQLIVGADNPDYSGGTYGGDDGGTDKVLTSNGTAGLKWTPAGGPSSFYNVMYENAQQTAKPAVAGPSVDLFIRNQTGFIPTLNCLVQFIANFSTTQNCTVLFELINNSVPSVLSTATQTVRNNGVNKHFHIPVNFSFAMPNASTLNFTIRATASVGDISVDTDDFYSIIVNQIRPSA